MVAPHWLGMVRVSDRPGRLLVGSSLPDRPEVYPQTHREKEREREREIEIEIEREKERGREKG